MKTYEGSLDILWVNQTEPTATPRYQLHFVRYKGFQNGAQPSKLIVGADQLETYLVDIEFKAQNARQWIALLHETCSVSIPNVMLPEQYLAPYIAHPA